MISRAIEAAIIILFITIILPGIASAECEKAQELYEQALTLRSDDEQKISLLNQSASECSGFPVYFELGKNFAERKDFDGSLRYFQKAAIYAQNDEEKGIIYRSMGIVSQAAGRRDDALVRYRQALQFMHSPEIETSMMQLEQADDEQVVDAETLLSRLAKTRSLSVVGVPQSITIRIHFNSNTSKLSPKGGRQAAELAKVMISKDFEGMRFRLVGHTDLKGNAELNKQLSLKRADAVRTYIVTHFDIQQERISVEGKGKEEPLYTVQSPIADALNRRVEVMVEDQ